jgi:hypothetical protein
MALILWYGPQNALVKATDSGGCSATDRIRLTDIYYGTFAQCGLGQLARGTFGSGQRAGWVVNQSTLSRQRGDVGKLVTEWEAGGTYATNPLPVGNFSLKPQELYPKIERNGFFAGILPRTVNGVYNARDSAIKYTGESYDSVDIGNYAVGMKPTGVDSHGNNIWPTPTTDQATQLALGSKLLEKITRGEETYYLVGWRYTYEVYSYTPPTLDSGGEPGTPGGPLASELPTDTAWLRLADDLDSAGVAGSMYKLNVTWLGGPVVGGVGFWDPDIYSK